MSESEMAIMKPEVWLLHCEANIECCVWLNFHGSHIGLGFPFLFHYFVGCVELVILFYLV